MLKENKKIPSLPLAFILFLSLLGLLISAYLVYHFYALQAGNSPSNPFCHLGPYFNCDLISSSSYAQGWFGFPLASYGLIWFMGLLILTLLSFSEKQFSEMIQAIFILSFFASLVSLYYLGIMTFKLKTYCLFCLLLDGVNFLVLGLSAFLKTFITDQKKTNSKLWLCISSVISFSSLLGFLSTHFLHQIYSGSEEKKAKRLVQMTLSKPPLKIPPFQNRPTLGSPSAPIQISVFSDFQCTYCQATQDLLNTLLKQYPHQIRITFYYFPLEKNRSSSSYQAAQMIHCAFLKDQFLWAYSQLLSQPFEDWIPLLEQKIPPKALYSCMNSLRTHQVILEDLELGKSLNLQFAPLFLINGYLIEGLPFFSSFWSYAIDSLLGKLDETH